jgi:methionine--tRNA ligase beta chain
MYYVTRFLTEAEPWKMKGADEPRRILIVRTALEAIYAFAHFLAPVIPFAAKAIFGMLNTGPVPATSLRRDFLNLTPGTPLTPGNILFQKIESAADPVVAAPPPKSSANKGAKAPKDERVYDPSQPDFTKIDLRVGKIVKVWNHETADRLYCEEIDVGEDSLRPVASGLRADYSLDELQDRLVVVVCNLKEAKMQGYVSAGMVLAAKSSDGAKTELLIPPPGAVVGERVVVAGLCGEAWPSAKVKKDKVWEAVSINLGTDGNCTACWTDQPLITEKTGLACTVKSNSLCKIY